MTEFERIQSSYLDLAEDYFGSLYRTSPTKDPAGAADHYARMSLAGSVMLENLRSLPQDIVEFWRSNEESLKSEIGKLNGLKANYGGDISPSDGPSLISRTGLYADTILIPDPILRCSSFVATDTLYPAYSLFYLLKHAFNVLNMRDLLLADVDPPIAVIYPSEIMLRRDNVNVCAKYATQDAVEYFSELFQQDFKNAEEVDVFLKDHNSISALVDAIKDHSVLIPDIRQESNVADGLRKFEEKHKSLGFLPVIDENIGNIIRLSTYGRLIGLGAHLSDCGSFRSEPLFDAPNSWHMYLWKIRNESMKITSEYSRRPDVDTMVVNAMQLDNLKWLGRVPLDKLVLLRKNGELSELREVLRREILEIKSATEDELSEVAKQVEYNMTEAFKRHSQDIRQIESRCKSKYNIDGGLIVVGAISAAASLVFPPACLLGLIGGHGIADLYLTYRERKEELDSLKMRPVGILFDVRSQSDE